MTKAAPKRVDTTVKERVRRLEANRRARGLREIRVWVPDDELSIGRIRALADTLCALKNAQDNDD